MVAWCAVYGCHNNRNNCSYSFFELPNDKSLAKEWKIKLNREGNVPKDDNYYVCEIQSRMSYQLDRCQNHILNEEQGLDICDLCLT